MQQLNMQQIVLLPQECEPVIYNWFEGLQERNSLIFATKNGRAFRAELRRASILDGVLTCKAYMYLCEHFFKVYSAEKGLSSYALAVFAAVAAHAGANNKSASFAAQLSEKVNNGERSYLSSPRFNRLLRANSPEELTRQLVRAVKLRGKEGVNLFSLADSIFLWMDEWYRKGQDLPADPDPFKRNAVRWALEYSNH